MLRALRTAALVFLAVLAADVAFRASLLRLLRPEILSPTDGAVVTPPVKVRWEGPREMQVTLRYAGREEWDLGVRQSPFEIPAQFLRERGLYSVGLRATALGDWISVSRSFSTDGEPPPPAPSPPPSNELASKLAALEDSLQQMRDAQEDAHDENTGLYEENASIREENAILTEELQQMAEAELRALGQIAAMEREYARLAEEHRALLVELAQTRARLSSVVPCSVWGYFSSPRPRIVPQMRRFVVVSDSQGEVFRTQSSCEEVRRTDQGAGSVCFCVGSSFGD